MRQEYTRARLDDADVDSDPIRQFHAWFAEVIDAGIVEPNAMTLATVSPGGRPSARVVLMRGFDERGFTFFTSYESRKARELESNPFAALVFFWAAPERQVRVEGRVERVTEAESDAYFARRPRGARLGAWASSQSATVAREVLEARRREVEAQFPGEVIPRPSFWGGYRLIPDAIEFWQGRPDRLHDRLLYRRRDGGPWRIERLSP